MMSILGISLMVGGAIVYGKLNGGFNDEPLFEENKDIATTDVYKETFNYLINLSYEELYEYINYNDILRNRYKDAIYNDCDMKDKAQICRYIANIARIESRPFNNKYIYY